MAIEAVSRFREYQIVISRPRVLNLILPPGTIVEDLYWVSCRHCRFYFLNMTAARQEVMGTCYGVGDNLQAEARLPTGDIDRDWQSLKWARCGLGDRMGEILALIKDADLQGKLTE